MLPSMNEIRKRLEFCNAQILKTYFAKGLTDNFIQQLTLVLQQQFKPDYYRNVEGSVFQREDDLELKIIKPELLRFAESALAQLVAGNRANLDLLTNFADDVYYQSPREQEDTELFTGFKEFIERIQQGYQFPKDLRKEFATHYQNFVLSRLFLYDPVDFKVLEEDFRALFLINENTAEPSQIEQKLNLQTKNSILLISANSDYVNSGVKLYLIHSGSFGILYEGPLKPNA